MTARYTAFNLFGARSDASICEVYFYIGSTEVRDQYISKVTFAYQYIIIFGLYNSC